MMRSFSEVERIALLKVAMRDAVANIGVPGDGYPMPISIAWSALQNALQMDDDIEAGISPRTGLFSIMALEGLAKKMNMPEEKIDMHDGN